MVPALIEPIKVAGLVLVVDASSDLDSAVPKPLGGAAMGASRGSNDGTRGVDGALAADGVLRFHASVDA